MEIAAKVTKCSWKELEGVPNMHVAMSSCFTTSPQSKQLSCYCGSRESSPQPHPQAAAGFCFVTEFPHSHIHTLLSSLLLGYLACHVCHAPLLIAGLKGDVACQEEQQTEGTEGPHQIALPTSIPFFIFSSGSLL